MAYIFGFQSCEVIFKSALTQTLSGASNEFQYHWNVHFLNLLWCLWKATWEFGVLFCFCPELGYHDLILFSECILWHTWLISLHTLPPHIKQFQYSFCVTHSINQPKSWAFYQYSVLFRGKGWHSSLQVVNEKLFKNTWHWMWVGSNFNDCHFVWPWKHI